MSIYVYLLQKNGCNFLLSDFSWNEEKHDSFDAIVVLIWKNFNLCIAFVNSNAERFKVYIDRMDLNNCTILNHAEPNIWIRLAKIYLTLFRAISDLNIVIPLNIKIFPPNKFKDIKTRIIKAHNIVFCEPKMI